MVHVSIIWRKNVYFPSNSKLNHVPNCFPKSINSKMEFLASAALLSPPWTLFSWCGHCPFTCQCVSDFCSNFVSNGGMSLRERTTQQGQAYKTHLIVLGLSNIRISLGQVIFKPFLNANFLNPFCLLIPCMFFFSLKFCLIVPHLCSIPVCPLNPGPYSILLSIACQGLFVPTYSMPALPRTRAALTKTYVRIIHVFSYIKSTMYMRERLYLASNIEFFIHNS